jgi:hypothetical protein
LTSCTTNATNTTSATTEQKGKKKQDHHEQNALVDYSVFNTNNTSNGIQKQGAVSPPPSLSVSTLVLSNPRTATTATHEVTSASTLKKKRKRSNRSQNNDNNPNPKNEREEEKEAMLNPENEREEEKEALLNQDNKPSYTTKGANHTAANNNKNGHSLPEDMTLSSNQRNEGRSNTATRCRPL